MKKVLIPTMVSMGAALLMPFFALAQTNTSRVILLVPFTAQAPFGVWLQPWQDFCEEAASVMAAHFVWDLPLTPKTADLEMQLIKQYESMVLRRYRDTSAAETAGILSRLYGMRDVSVRSVASMDDIKKEIKSGKLVIVPTAGQMLDNPHYIPPGPLYHMVVVKGFDDAKNVFITNDPGTRFGESYAYNQQKLFAAIHDWNNGDVLHGEKKMIVVGR